MKFQSEIVPWLPELKNYLKDSSKKIGEIKKILRSVDFSKMDYPTQVRLAAMFDPRCEITEELFKRQVNLYFSLLESKTSPVTIPIFSNYIDWIYSQDIDKLTDPTFDIISSRLLKTTASSLSEPINSFMSRLPEEYNKDIDKLSNSRINTLINILNETKNSHENMPAECRNFVKNMFKACAVKAEIADKNKQKFRGLFRDDPRGYYGLFNKAFAGVDAYDSWIDEPAKKLSFKNMVNYANYQSQVLKNVKYGLRYSTFVSCADDLKLPRLTEYDPDSVFFTKDYLKEPREYKDYAKKMGDLFVQMVKFEVKKVAEKIDNGTLTESDLDEFAVTNKMADRIGNIQISDDKKNVLRNFAYCLIDMVHLDELTGQSFRDIYNENDYISSAPKQQTMQIPKQNEEDKPETQEHVSSMVQLPDYEMAEENKNLDSAATVEAESKTAIDEKVSTDEKVAESGEQSEYAGIPYDYAYDMTLDDRILSSSCVPEDMPELMERYNDLISNNKHDFYLENALFDLEARMRDNEIDEFEETEPSVFEQKEKE